MFRVCLCAVLLTACAGSGARITKDLHALEDQADLKRAKQELDHRLTGIRTLKAVGQLAGSWMGRQGVYQMVCAVRWPTDLRIDLLDPAVGTVASLVVTQGELEWYLPKDARVYRSAATAEAMGRATQLKWSPAEVTGLLAGLPPMEYGDRFADWWLGPEGLAVSPDEHAVLSFAPGGRFPERYVRYHNADRRRVAAVVHFGAYRPVKGFQLPHELRIEVMHPKTTLTVLYESVEINTPLAAEAFTLPAPEGTPVYELR